jgi:alpha-tubulin suppressor-like RCC1 family protein
MRLGPRRGMVALCTALAGCGTDLPEEPTRTVTLEPLAWPAELAVTQVDTLEVDVRLLGSTTRVTGLRLKWQSSDESVLKVAQLQLPAGAGREDTLASQLRAVATAQAGGFARVSVIIEGDGPFEPTVVGDTIEVTEKWVSIAAGSNHSCGVTVGGEAFCWGSGFLGNGSAGGSPIPVEATGGLQFGAVTAGDGHTCGTLVDGRVYCWGLNRYGAIGNGSRADELIPVPVALGRTFRAIAAGEDGVVCGVTLEGLGFCWGKNDLGQLGDGGRDMPFGPVPPFDDCGSTPDLPLSCSLTPRSVEDIGFHALPLSAIGPGFSHTCAVLTSGAPVCWGSGSEEIGSDAQVQSDTARLVPGSVQLASVSAGLFHTCGLTASPGQVYCWGTNSAGQLGRLSPASSATPLLIADQREFLRLSVGERSTCGILAADSTVYCWGSNEFDQLGRTGSCDPGTPVRCAVPVKIELSPALKVISIGVGRHHACAATLGGAAFCWGETAGGKLGNATVSAAVSPPVRISEPSRSK